MIFLIKTIIISFAAAAKTKTYLINQFDLNSFNYFIINKFVKKKCFSIIFKLQNRLVNFIIINEYLSLEIIDKIG